MREQVERLEYHPDLLADPLRANVRVVHLDPLQKDVTRVWLDEEVDATEQRALARTTRAHDDEDFSLFHFQVVRRPRGPTRNRHASEKGRSPLHRGPEGCGQEDAAPLHLPPQAARPGGRVSGR